MWFYLVAELSALERLRHQPLIDVGVKSILNRKAYSVSGSGRHVWGRGDPLFMSRIMAGHAVTRDSDKMADAGRKSNYNAIANNLQPLSELVFKTSSYERREIEVVVVDHDCVSKTDVEGIAETNQSKWTSTRSSSHSSPLLRTS